MRFVPVIHRSPPAKTETVSLTLNVRIEWCSYAYLNPDCPRQKSFGFFSESAKWALATRVSNSLCNFSSDGIYQPLLAFRRIYILESNERFIPWILYQLLGYRGVTETPFRGFLDNVFTGCQSQDVQKLSGR